MAATTTKVTATTAAYQLVAQGQGKVVLQILAGAQAIRKADDVEAVRVAIGASLPAAGATNYFTLKAGAPLALADLGLLDNVYVRADSGNNAVEAMSWAANAAFDASLALTFIEDFLGPALEASQFGTRDTNGATETLLANGANGEVALALTSTNEAQLAGIDWTDQRSLVLNRGLVFEARVNLSVLPTGSVVGCVGLCGNHNAAVNTVAESIWFRVDGSGAITVETDDVTHETSQVATGVTLTTADWAVLRIDCTDPTSVKFYINGTRVAAGTTFDMSAVPTLALQPVARIGKESAATTVGTLLVDYVRCTQNRA